MAQPPWAQLLLSPSINRQSHGTASMGSATAKALEGVFEVSGKKLWPILQPRPGPSMLGFRKPTKS